MLDVFCCALGCVTLLWLLNTRQARVQADRLAQTRVELQTSTTHLSESRLQSANLEQELAQAWSASWDERHRHQNMLRTAEQQAEDLRRALALARSQTEATQQELALARTQSDELTDALARLSLLAEDAQVQLARKQEDLDDAAAALNRARLDLRVLDRTRDEAETLTQRVKELTEALNKLDARYRAALTERDAIQRDLASMGKLQSELNKTRDELARSSKAIIDLQTDKSRLNSEIEKFRQDDESRFAGIALTGTQVVFLIDMSGSMGLKDYDTPDPAKWGLACDTVGRVMRSIPTLEKFQVILFSKEKHYPLGGEGAWLDYQGERTVNDMVAVMREFKPSGGTNIHLGMEAAFRYRQLGMDTLYMFSDGLPNLGPGIDSDSRLSQVERTAKLSDDLRTQIRENWNKPTASGKQVRINSIGFFYESPDVGSFLWALSRENDGSFVGMSKP